MIGRLVVPAAGLSTRYGLSRPKFLLQHPEGRTMLAAGLSGLPHGVFEEVVIVSLQHYFDGYDLAAVTREVEAAVGSPVRLMLLEEPTTSMVDTIKRAVYEFPDDSPLVLKDTDNLIAVDELPVGEGFVTYVDLARHPEVVAANKSYIERDSNGLLENIVEKRVISNDFNSGLIGFRSAAQFLTVAETLTGANRSYVSDIVRSLLDEGEAFRAVEAADYEDWGTLAEWRRYCRSFATLFVDIDGVTGQNENPYGDSGGWSRFRPIQENVDWLVQRERTGRVRIVFTTSRREEFRKGLTASLRESGFQRFDLVMGLPHAQRILLNDFAPTNPYPSAIAVNLERNSTAMSQYLPGL